MSRLRLLDFDDLFLLSHLLEGSTIAATAKQLGLTQPAITQRVRKIERVFGEPILQKVGRHVRLTKDGRAICTKAADALALMREVAAEPSASSLMIGAPPGVVEAWLYPAMSALHEADAGSGALFHAYVGGDDELLSLLESGLLDACLVAAASPPAAFGVVEIAEEERLLVARPDVAAAIAEPSDLAGKLLLEVDRSHPSLQRIDAAARASLRFRDSWMLGSQANVLAAALAGHGVAILPRGAVDALIGLGKLAVLLPEIDVAPERHRLVYKLDRATDALVQRLAQQLKEQRKRR